MAKQCIDLKGDRGLGEYWERQFCLLAFQEGYSFTPLQIGKNEAAVAWQRDEHENTKWNPFLLPDVVIWTSPGEHHEVKHKNPTRFGTFGLEVYRFESLLRFAEETKQDVMYTIHNHDLSGGRDGKVNYIIHWVTANVLDLDGTWKGEYWGPSWVNGKEKRVPIYYWNTDLWIPLGRYWGNK